MRDIRLGAVLRIAPESADTPLSKRQRFRRQVDHSGGPGDVGLRPAFVAADQIRDLPKTARRRT